MTTIHGILEDSAGVVASGTQIVFKPRSTSVRGQVVISNTPVSVTTTAGGAFTILLVGGDYDVLVGKYLFSISVPDDGLEYDIGLLVTKLNGPTGPTGGVGSGVTISQVSALIGVEQQRAQNVEQGLIARLGTLEAGNTNGVDQTARDAVDELTGTVTSLGNRVTSLENAPAVDQVARTSANAAQTTSDAATTKANAAQATADEAKAAVDAHAQTLTTLSNAVTVLQNVALVILNQPQDPDPANLQDGKLYLNFGTKNLFWKDPVTGQPVGFGAQ